MALKKWFFIALYINTLQNLKNGQTTPDCPGNQLPAHALPRLCGAYSAKTVITAKNPAEARSVCIMNSINGEFGSPRCMTLH